MEKLTHKLKTRTPPPFFPLPPERELQRTKVVKEDSVASQTNSEVGFQDTTLLLAVKEFRRLNRKEKLVQCVPLGPFLFYLTL
jgi:hypothetical protein